MSYLSPLHILESIDINPDELKAEGIIRLRKKLLADFNLSGEVTIDIGGKKYSKDEILKTIDKLKDLENLDSHLRIFENKTLLNWIESPNPTHFFKYDFINFLKGKEQDPFYGDTVGLALFDFLFKKVKSRKFKDSSDVLVIITSLTYTDISPYYDKLYNEIHFIVEDLSSRAHASNVPMDKVNFRFIAEPDWADFLNYLPDGFEEIRNEYCRTAINYISVIHKSFAQFAYEINYMLTQTECDYDLKVLIENNQKILDSNASAGGGETSSWGYIKIILWVGFILFRMIACAT
jgi:hypothetical protein